MATNDKYVSDVALKDKPIKRIGLRIKEGSITNPKIADGAVTADKIADNAIEGRHIVDDSIEARHILDNSIPGEKIKDGTIENVDIKDGTLSGEKLKDNTLDGSKLMDDIIESRHLKDNSIGAEKIKDGTIENVDIKDGTLSGEKIKDNTIQGIKLQDGAVGEDKLIDNSITTVKIAPNAVTEDKIADESVTNTKIATDAVTTAKIGDGEVQENHIANGAVTTAKLADGMISEVATITDAHPVEGSVKPIQSGGVQEALLDRAIVGDIVGDPAEEWVPGTAEAYIDQRIDEQNNLVNTRMNRQDTVINAVNGTVQTIQQAVELLNGSEVIVVADHTSVSSPDSQKIYREQGTTTYTDWMYQGGAWKEIATYSFPGIDDEPTAGSVNLVQSGGVYDAINIWGNHGVDFSINDDHGYDIVQFANGHIKTKNFDSTKAVTDDNIVDKIKRFHYPNFIGSPQTYVPTIDGSNQTVFSNLNAIYSAWDSLAEDYPDWLVGGTDLGYDESGSYVMRYYTLRMQHPSVHSTRAVGSTPNLWDDSVFNYRHILLVMGVHATEKGAILGGYLAIKSLLESNEPWAVFIKSNFVIDIVPCANPYGAARGITNNVNNVNLNRDYDSADPQQETINMKNLITGLIPKGLIAVIDLHNTSSSHGGYFVTKTNYKYYKYYAVLTQQLQAVTYDLWEKITEGTEYADPADGNYFHLWNYEDTDETGQLHEYIDSLGLLGGTVEVVSGLNESGDTPKKGSEMTSILAINMMNALGTYLG